MSTSWGASDNNQSNQVSFDSTNRTEIPSNLSFEDEDAASIISSLNGANANLFGKANSVFAGANMSYSFPAHGFRNGSDASAPPQVQASMANPSAIITAALESNNNMNQNRPGSIEGFSDSGSDRLINALNLKDSSSAVSAPVGQPTNGSQSRFVSNLFQSASVAGINVNSGFPNTVGTGSFLEKFGSVTEKTRELEMNLNKLSLGKNTSAPGTSASELLGSRRSSVLPNESAVMSSPQATFREPSRQSFSEKLDIYINKSNKEGRHMSFGSDVHSEHNSLIMDRNGNDSSSSHHNLKNHSHNIWNPATATTFHPTDYQQQRFPPDFNNNNFYNPNFMPPQMQFQMMGAPFGNFFPPQMQFFPQNQQPEKNLTPSTEDNKDPNNQTSGDESPAKDKDAKTSSISPLPATSVEGNMFPAAGDPRLAGMNNNGDINTPMSPFIMPPFSPPYGMFNPQTPPGAIIPGQMNQDPGFLANTQPFDLNNTQKIGHNTPPNKNSISSNNNNGNNSRNAFAPQGANSINNGNGASGMRKSPAPRGNNKKKIYRSPLLEDFRSNKNKEYFLKDIYGHGIEFSKDQHGSRFIQQQLQFASPADKEVIFNEIREVAPELMTDVFGNYVIQKFFEFGSATQKSILLESMKGGINNLSLQMYGCRVVQKALEAVTLEEQLMILNELRDNVLALVKDQNGNHVIQKSIECIPIENSSFILDSLRHQIYHLSTHTYGCRVIQRLLEYSDEKDQRFILDELNSFMYYLIQDQYGNYVIQHIIEHGEPKDRNLIIDVVLKHLVELSKHKFASNAVEKCIIFGDAEHRRLIYQEILKDNMDSKLDADVDENSPLALMMKDQYANYVVQKMVDLSTGNDKTLLIVKIRKCLEQINKNNFGKHLASIEKLIALSESISVQE